MLPDTIKTYSSKAISNILFKNPVNLLSEFYEMQNHFLIARYRINKSIETSNILTFLGRSLHLAIFRQREKDLNHNISLKNFFNNNKIIKEHGHKIVSIVKSTGIPKETVRRKLKNLIEKKIIIFNKKHKEYTWNLVPKDEEMFMSFMNEDIKSIAKFVWSITKYLDLKLKINFIEEEIKEQFSFYYYHYYSCQLNWMKMWQTKIKDIDLIFIVIQALIPTLKNSNINHEAKQENIHTMIGKIDTKANVLSNAVSANSISEISGIPRATCIRKLDKLVQLGMLVRETKTKRYYVNQNATDRTKHITKKENVIFTINVFSEFLSIIISALLRNK